MEGYSDRFGARAPAEEMLILMKRAEALGVVKIVYNKPTRITEGPSTGGQGVEQPVIVDNRQYWNVTFDSLEAAELFCRLTVSTLVPLNEPTEQGLGQWLVKFKIKASGPLPYGEPKPRLVDTRQSK